MKNDKINAIPGFTEAETYHFHSFFDKYCRLASHSVNSVCEYGCESCPINAAMKRIFALPPLYLIIGKSGSGKTTLADRIAADLGKQSVSSYTTRPPRYPDEPSHIFVSKEQFDALTLVAYTQFNGYEYGTTAEVLDRSHLYVIDIDGVYELFERYHTERPVYLVYLDVSEETSIQRMKMRGDSDEVIRSRIATDNTAFNNARTKLDYNLVIDANKDADTIYNEFKRFIALKEG